VDEAHAAAVAAIAGVRERLAASVPRAEPVTGPRAAAFSSNIGSEGYASAVESVKEYIRAGDAYQIVPSQRWSSNCPVEAFSI
jgi:anthranilate synthase component 1